MPTRCFSELHPVGLTSKPHPDHFRDFYDRHRGITKSVPDGAYKPHPGQFRDFYDRHRGIMKLIGLGLLIFSMLVEVFLKVAPTGLSHTRKLRSFTRFSPKLSGWGLSRGRKHIKKKPHPSQFLIPIGVRFEKHSAGTRKTAKSL